jgi:hypothetical protein
MIIGRCSHRIGISLSSMDAAWSYGFGARHTSHYGFISTALDLSNQTTGIYLTHEPARMLPRHPGTMREQKHVPVHLILTILQTLTNTTKNTVSLKFWRKTGFDNALSSLSQTQPDLYCVSGFMASTRGFLGS